MESEDINNNYYETIVIIKNSLSNKQKTEIVNKYVNIIQKYSKQKQLKLEVLGEKRMLAASDERYGYFMVITFQAQRPTDIVELKHLYGIDKNILKFIVCKIENPNLPDLKSEQPQQDNKFIDALDVLLGLAKYNK